MNPISPQEREDDKPAIVYLRCGIFVRDAARAEAEITPLAREISTILSRSGLAALAGSVLGLLAR